ncbi:MAG: hypothetical protein A2V67_05150 [Deltaproteobacteria bacterium RBG_13_61_14]|nr:MAG: hypothetical protein A2V67_05150 [Deltaproteobacteria bacterium RBG_13_61_14]
MSEVKAKLEKALELAGKPVDPRSLEEYSKLYTPAISDALDNLGLRPGFMDLGIKPMWPGARLVGYAATIELKAEKSFDESGVQAMMEMLGKVGKNRAVVMSMSGLWIAAGLGQITSMICQRLGVTGGVVDGAVRDLAQVNALKFPLFARGTIPSSIRGRMSLGSLMEPVTCGGVVVHPGDLVMGDINGVVVVPGDEAQPVLDEAKKIIRADAFWQKAMEQGRDPAEIEREVPLP